jgi:hypothetical protein
MMSAPARPRGPLAPRHGTAQRDEKDGGRKHPGSGHRVLFRRKGSA